MRIMDFNLTSDSLAVFLLTMLGFVLAAFRFFLFAAASAAAVSGLNSFGSLFQQRFRVASLATANLSEYLSTVYLFFLAEADGGGAM